MLVPHRFVRSACPWLLALFSGAACATQGYYFTFTNNSAEPIYVDFDTVKGSQDWSRETFQGKVLIAPHTTTARMYTESTTWPVLVAASQYVSFMLYPVSRPEEADTVIVINKLAQPTFACTTENTPLRPTKTYGWINYWRAPSSSGSWENVCNMVDGQSSLDRYGNRYVSYLASEGTTGTFAVNVAYEPRGDGKTMPRATYYFHVSVPHDDRFYHDFDLSSISGEDPQAGQN